MLYWEGALFVFILFVFLVIAFTYSLFLGGVRYAHLMKSPTHESKSVPFVITPDGIRDVTNEVQGADHDNIS